MPELTNKYKWTKFQKVSSKFAEQKYNLKDSSSLLPDGAFCDKDCFS